MKIIHGLSIVCLLLLLTACPGRKPANQTPAPCTEQWHQNLEKTISTGDGMGHGPDIGSEEWKSVIEFRLKIRGNPDVPDRNSPEWCLFIDGLLQGKPKE